MQEDLIKCPHCGSTQIHADKKGFSTGKAIASTMVGGIFVGAAVGSIGKDKIVLTCLKCGHTFKIGESNSTTFNPPKIEGYVGYDEKATYKCSRCGKISTVSGSSYCPRCGNRFSESDVYVEPKKRGNAILIVIAIIVAILILLFAL